MGVLQDSMSQGGPQGAVPQEAAMRGPPSQEAPPPADVPEGEWVGKVVAAVDKIVGDPKSGPSILKSLTKADAVEAVSRTTANLISSIDRQVGGNLPEEDILPAGIQVLEKLIDLREQSTGVSLSEDEMKRAVAGTIAALAEAYGTTQEQAQEFSSQFGEQEIAEANQAFGGGV